MVGMLMTQTQRMTLECKLCQEEFLGDIRVPLCRLDAELRLLNHKCPLCGQHGKLKKEKAEAYIRRLPELPNCKALCTLEDVGNALAILSDLGKLPELTNMVDVRGIFDTGSSEYRRSTMEEKAALFLKLAELGFTPGNLIRALLGLLQRKGYHDAMVMPDLVEGLDALLAYLKGVSNAPAS